MTTTPDFRALCAELVDKLDYHASEHSVDELIARARAVLATPPPEPPTDEELWAFWNNHDGPIPAIFRAALHKWGHV